MNEGSLYGDWWSHILPPTAMLSLSAAALFPLVSSQEGPEGSTSRMEETCESECSLSELKISLRHSPPPLLLSLILSVAVFLALSPFLCLTEKRNSKK